MNIALYGRLKLFLDVFPLLMRDTLSKGAHNKRKTYSFQTLVGRLPLCFSQPLSDCSRYTDLTGRTVWVNCARQKRGVKSQVSKELMEERDHFYLITRMKTNLSFFTLCFGHRSEKLSSFREQSELEGGAHTMSTLFMHNVPRLVFFYSASYVSAHLLL